MDLGRLEAMHDWFWKSFLLFRPSVSPKHKFIVSGGVDV